MSRRRVQIVLLCEDAQHESFLRRFLSRQGWETRQVRVEKAPAGRGSGEQFVRERFPKELVELRRAHVDRSLVVMIDGDRSGPKGRLAQIEEATRLAGVPPRTATDRVAVLVPTWNIETWFAYLDGGDVDEGRSDYPRLRRQRECQMHVDSLGEMCDRGALRRSAPASLEVACEEFRSRLDRPVK